MVTRDYADFHRLTVEFQRDGKAHAGVLLVPPSLPNEHARAIAEALLQYSREHPDGVPAYMIDYVRAARA